MSVRPVTPDDFDVVAALVVEDEEQLTGKPSRVAATDVRQWLAGVELARHTWLFEDAARPVAVGWIEPHEAVAVAVGVVHPVAKGRGLGAQLIERSEQALRGTASRRVHSITLAADPAAPRLLARHGYREVRRFFDMGIELEAPPPPPVLPDSLTIETLRVEDARSFYAALEESFQDHWEHHTRPFEEWWAEQQSKPDFDPTLWFLVRDGEEVAATVRSDPNLNGGGWVGAIGVRPRWRRRGLARALLLHTFSEFHRRGVNRISLGVDSESPTGATKLYESVGMVRELEQVVHEKVLQ